MGMRPPPAASAAAGGQPSKRKRAREACAGILTQVRGALEQMPPAQREQIAEFDAVTAAALLWFAQQRCDIVCLETGLGGRLDATNAVDNTLVACIMAIGKDHTELLGHTYAGIAAEKCGIFKPGCSVVAYPAQPEEAMRQIEACAAAAHCPLCVPQPEDFHFYRGRPFENRGVVDTKMQRQIRMTSPEQCKDAHIFHSYYEQGQLRSPNEVALQIEERYVSQWSAKEICEKIW